jgi:hypothetical protein
MKAALLFFLVMAAQSFAGDRPTRIIVRRQIDMFITEVGRFCVTRPDATIERMVDGIQLTEVPGCVAELKKIARAWNQASKREPVVAVRVLPERREITRKALAEEFQGLNYVIDTQACHCLVFRGAQAREWANAAQAIAVER